jgi:putative glutathione S-transferase
MTDRPESGAFLRKPVAMDERITGDGSSRWPVEPDRYRLVVARACPWANRAVIVRRLLGLEPVISMGIAGPLHDERSWRFHLDPDNRDPVLGIEYLGEAYRRADPHFDAGITVPAMVEVATGKVATNGFGRLTLDFATQWTAHHRDGAPRLYPAALRTEIDEINDAVY